MRMPSDHVCITFRLLAQRNLEVFRFSFQIFNDYFVPQEHTGIDRGIQQYSEEMYDFHTVGIVALHKRYPLATVASLNRLNVLFENGTVQINREQINALKVLLQLCQLNKNEKL